ncbi:MAG: hypothetical protein AUJ07_00415 [Crenarchaeota archaeon 13_1_40CM_3_53_5]|nr:MAG: hypothetical protein AUJ07_00415 [Crenarchaeota archaeon 13_1_40CM_3_53_5]
MPVATAFAPCQITGFFTIQDKAKNPLRVGSTGAGVNLEEGVTTTVSVTEASRSRTTITLNGNILPNPVVSKEVVRQYLHRDGRTWNVRVSHSCELPIGCGYGTSGAGALSLSFSLNQVLGESLTSFEAAAVAHQAEVTTKSGLGTVTSVFFGGVLVRLTPGSPGLARVTKTPISDSSRVVSGSLGPLPTRTALSNRRFANRVNTCGSGLVQMFRRQSNDTGFLLISRRFADCLGSASPRLKGLFRLGDEFGVVFSMMMIGESGFTIVSGRMVEEAARLMRVAGFVPRISRIANEGARLV